MLTQSSWPLACTLTQSSFCPNAVLQHYAEGDYHKIIAGLYIGDKITAANRKLLGQLGIKHIVTVGQELESGQIEGCRYMHIRVRDHKLQDITAYFQESKDFIEEAMAKKEAILVHCAKGISRSASIVIAYLMAKYRMSSNEAFAFVRRKRREIRPNQGFMLQLKKFEETLELGKK